MARKSPSFGQLLAYISLTDQSGPAIGHNLQATECDLAAIHREFLDNSRYLPPRKNGNVLYHEVLSFSDLDQPGLTPAILESLTRKYLELRAPYALAYAKAHLETDCPHVHVMISANNVGSSRRLRLSRAEFARVKRELEEYQRQEYPLLTHSLVFDRERSRQGVRQRRNESERDRRLAKKEAREPSRKEMIRDLVAEQLVLARSAQGFALRLKTLGLQLYRRGRQFGVLDLVGHSDTSAPGRRYRLSTLGLQDQFQKALRQWQVLPERLLALEGSELERTQQLWRVDGHRAEIRDVMALRSSELSPLERDRLEQIRLLRTASQQKGREPPGRQL